MDKEYAPGRGRLTKRVPGDTPVTLYHGTSTGNLTKIAKEGIKNIHNDDPRYNMPSATIHKPYTAQWKEEAAQRDGGDEVVLRAKMPRGKLRVNRENMNAYSDNNASRAQAVFVRGGIPPDRIEVEQNKKYIPLNKFAFK